MVSFSAEAIRHQQRELADKPSRGLTHRSFLKAEHEYVAAEELPECLRCVQTSIEALFNSTRSSSLMTSALQDVAVTSRKLSSCLHRWAKMLDQELRNGSISVHESLSLASPIADGGTLSLRLSISATNLTDAVAQAGPQALGEEFVGEVKEFCGGIVPELAILPHLWEHIRGNQVLQ